MTQLHLTLSNRCFHDNLVYTKKICGFAVLRLGMDKVHSGIQHACIDFCYECQIISINQELLY